MIKLADIAKETGFSISTISSALSGRGRVAPKTAAAIRKAAEALGYRGNAAAALLAAQKQQNRNKNSQMKIAWIAPHPMRASLEGFSSACNELGYEGDWVNPHDYPSAKAMVRILYNRGYSGGIFSSIFSPWSEDELLEADWSLLSMVKLTRIFPRLCFHLVRHSAFDYMIFLLHEMQARGYRRIAALLIDSGAMDDEYARIGALLAFREEFTAVAGSLAFRRLPGAKVPEALDEDTRDWLESWQPDAVVGFPHDWIVPLRGAGYRIPESLAYATPYSSLHFQNAVPTSGCDPQQEVAASRAVRLLHTLIQRGERGMTNSFLQDVIIPKWLDAGTLPYKSATNG